VSAPYWKKLDAMSDEEIWLAYEKCQEVGHTKSGESHPTVPPQHFCSKCGAKFFEDGTEISKPNRPANPNQSHEEK